MPLMTQPPFFVWLIGLGLVVPILFVHPVGASLVGPLVGFFADVDAEVGAASQKLVFAVEAQLFNLGANIGSFHFRWICGGII